MCDFIISHFLIYTKPILNFLGLVFVLFITKNSCRYFFSGEVLMNIYNFNAKIGLKSRGFSPKSFCIAHFALKCGVFNPRHGKKNNSFFFWISQIITLYHMDFSCFLHVKTELWQEDLISLITKKCAQKRKWKNYSSLRLKSLKQTRFLILLKTCQADFGFMAE